MKLLLLLSDTDSYNEQCSRDVEPHQWNCLRSYQVPTVIRLVLTQILYRI